MTVVPLQRRARKVSYRAGLDDRLGNLAAFLPGFALHLKAKGQATKTIEKKITAVDQLAEFLGDPDLAAVTRADIERFMVERLRVSTRSSAATTFNALRSFFGPYTGRNGDEKPYLVIELGAYDSPMVGLQAPRAEEPEVAELPVGLLGKLIAGAERARPTEWEDLRDAALLRCFVDTGARLSEITNLDLADILPLDDGRMLLRVFGKGRGGGLRERHVPIGDKAGVALRRYLRARSGHPYASSPRLWVGMRGPLTPSGVRRMIYRRSEKAGHRINPHKLRHNWAVTMKADERKRDADIMHLAGWTDHKMLARYGKAATAKRAVEKFWDHGAPGDAI